MRIALRSYEFYGDVSASRAFRNYLSSWMDRPALTSHQIAIFVLASPSDPRIVSRFTFTVTEQWFFLMNANTTERYQLTYGTTYLNPLSITAARFFKIGVQVDF